MFQTPKATFMKALLTLSLLVTSLLTVAQTIPARDIENLVKPYLESRQNQTVAIGLIRHGEKQIIYVGSRLDAHGNQIASPIFEIGELSSLFTTTLLARMAILGEVNIETPVQQLMPGQRLPVYQKLNCEPVGLNNSLYACDPLWDDQVISLVLCNLATHTAGFPRNPLHLNVLLHPRNPFARYHQKQLYRYLNNHPIGFTNGFTYQYSHNGISLLGHSLSLHAATGYEDLLEHKVLLPLQLSDSKVTLTAAQRSRFLQGYSGKGKTTPAWDVDILAPSAGIHSTIEDMLQFLSVQLGEIHREWLPTVKLAHNPREIIRQHELAGSETGLGWLSTHVPGLSNKVTWMAGLTGGFASYIGFVEESQTGVVILSNRAIPILDIGMEALKVLNRPVPERTVIIPAAIH
jgi:serine-type D-Ala-D-Ala carboxypeptidase/endopeptidase